MKKLITVLTSIMLMSTAAFAGSFQIGTKGSLAFLEATGTETTTAGAVTGGAANTNTASVNNDVALPSLYAEYSLDSSLWGTEGNEITLGAQLTLGDADVSDKLSQRSETAEDADGNGSTGALTYKAQASVENLTNYYIEVPLVSSLYAKIGFSQLDVITQESTNHHGSYGNDTLDGTQYGIGFKGLSGNLAWKVSYETTDWDQLALTSTTSNKITANLDVDELALSLGYRF